MEYVEMNRSSTDAWTVIKVFPPTNWDDTRILVISGTYFLLFLLGIGGNSGILSVVAFLQNNNGAPQDNAIIYMGSLCCVDLAIMLSLPFIIMDQILGFWMFGTPLCKLYWLLESVGKVLSTFILTAMSFDRFVGVCYPHRTVYRTRKACYIILLSVSMLALSLLTPLLVKAVSTEMALPGVLPVLNSKRRSATVIRVIKCIANMDRELLVAFTIYTFILGHLIPFLLMSYFYIRMLRTLQRHMRTMRKSQIPLRRISLYTLAICCFYFICWTPYWGSMVYQIYEETQNAKQYQPSLTYVYMMYCIHALPYVNAAGNWVLYGLLNSQLTQRSGGSRKGTARSKSAPDMTRSTISRLNSNMLTNKLANNRTICTNCTHGHTRLLSNCQETTPMLTKMESLQDMVMIEE